MFGTWNSASSLSSCPLLFTQVRVQQSLISPPHFLAPFFCAQEGQYRPPSKRHDSLTHPSYLSIHSTLFYCYHIPICLRFFPHSTFLMPKCRGPFGIQFCRRRLYS